jgi:hypothetical protein
MIIGSVIVSVSRSVNVTVSGCVSIGFRCGEKQEGIYCVRKYEKEPEESRTLEGNG